MQAVGSFPLPEHMHSKGLTHKEHVPEMAAEMKSPPVIQSDSRLEFSSLFAKTSHPKRLAVINKCTAVCDYQQISMMR